MDAITLRKERSPGSLLDYNTDDPRRLTSRRYSARRVINRRLRGPSATINPEASESHRLTVRRCDGATERRCFFAVKGRSVKHPVKFRGSVKSGAQSRSDDHAAATRPRGRVKPSNRSNRAPEDGSNSSMRCGRDREKGEGWVVWSGWQRVALSAPTNRRAGARSLIGGSN